MLIYVIMIFFKVLSQGPITINYAGSNHLIYCAVERTCIVLFLRHHKEIGLGMEVDAGKHHPSISHILTNKMH